MRYGVALSTVVVGLAAVALAFVPLALRHHGPAPLEVFEGSTSVYIVPLAGGVPQELMRLHGQWAFPVATPDGKSLLIERPKVPSGVQLWRVSLDGSHRTRLGAIQVFQKLAWSEDRSEYAFTGPTALQVARVDGTPVRKLGLSDTIASWNGDYIAGERESRPSSGYRLDIHVWRADGRLMWSTRMPFPAATVAVARDGQSVVAVRMHRLELVTPHGRRLLASDASGWALTWTPDGRSLLYYDTTGRLVLRNVATGAVRTVVHGGRYADATISPDGRTVYVLRLNDAVSIPK